MKKASMGSYSVTVVFLLALSLCASAEQLSSRECENLGFTGLALCSDCNTLSEYVKDKGNNNFKSLFLFQVSFKMNFTLF